MGFIKILCISDDSWMTISGDDLERIMTERYGARSQTTDITSSLTAFLNNISGLDGVQHPKPRYKYSSHLKKKLLIVVSFPI